ncbi:GntR family transcriptional regulator [Neptunicoccus cionae]|uniref:GntR family transcriptional regulator n=1 Tax=Neptunicoccus cionae TaxID=2035344 RepID=UPI000C75A97A|nr:GntR family transcriptional regulator [Amylibacter cionae]PLS21172.1 hypothetical protein C0U40_13585 [Amylibacter cionae]
MNRQATIESDSDINKALKRAMLQEIDRNGMTKRQALRVALVNAIHSGTLAPGLRLPSETDLAESLGVSLGTVQTALGQVQDLGLIKRRRGDGTRVLDCSVLPPNIWHFRMHHIESGNAFRMINQKIEIASTDSKGPWCDHLGACPEYTVIRRSIIGTHDLRVGAEMILDARLVPAASLAAHSLRQSNLRTILEARLGVVAVQGKRSVSLEDIDVRQAALFELPMDGPFFKIEATTFLSDQRPFYFQTLHVPADRVTLEF